MKITISLRGLVQTVLLLISIGLLWTTVAFYSSYSLDEVTRFGTDFLLVYAIFLALFFEGRYRTVKEQRPAQAQVLVKVVNRVLRDAGMAALAGFVLESARANLRGRTVSQNCNFYTWRIHHN